MEEIGRIRREYREQLKFSRWKLDDACENQPELFDRWQQDLVDAMALQEMEKDRLSGVRAELDSKLRKALAEKDELVSVEEFDCYKSTEGAIALSVDNHSDMKKAHLKVAYAVLKVNVLKGATEAFQQRKSMLQQMTQLFITGYFGDVEYGRKEFDKKVSVEVKIPKENEREVDNSTSDQTRKRRRKT